MADRIQQYLNKLPDRRVSVVLQQIFGRFISTKADDGASPTVALKPARVITAEGAPSSVATAGAGTISAAHVMSGIYVRDCAGAGRTDTFDTGAAIVAAVPNAAVGDVLRLLIVNGSDAAETITLGVPASGGFDTNQTATARVIPQFHSKLVHIRLTNVTAGAEAYVVYA